jgi:8-oxo-dGTP pyrophosphatase MutT (NUDIX family)
VDLLHEIKKRVEEGALSGGSNDFSGYKRISAIEARMTEKDFRESAVLFPLFLRNGVWNTAFIRRTQGQGVHSGQLSFPGGKLEPGETQELAALRETEEEVGLTPASIQIECRLNEIFIPPSKFIVSPFLGIVASDPVFAANSDEVDEIIEFPVTNFLKENIIIKKEVFVPAFQRNIEVDSFDIKGQVLWGATAMMVQEFRTALGFWK